MWGYFGSKTGIIDLYPKPKFKKIIEPFAGAAKYALKHFDNEVTIIDAYEDLIKVWLWLKSASPSDVLSMPRHVKQKQHIDDFTFDHEGAKILFGFLLGKASERPRKTASDRVSIIRPNHINFTLKKIAAQLYKIRHWDIILGDYQDIPNQTATWFIDPPYQHGGHVYVKSNKHINFKDLSHWCQSRRGQAIVCENHKADWMEFTPIASFEGTSGAQREVIWSNLPINTGQQMKIF